MCRALGGGRGRGGVCEETETIIGVFSARYHLQNEDEGRIGYQHLKCANKNCPFEFNQHLGIPKDCTAFVCLGKSKRDENYPNALCCNAYCRTCFNDKLSKDRKLQHQIPSDWDDYIWHRSKFLRLKMNRAVWVEIQYKNYVLENITWFKKNS